MSIPMDISKDLLSSSLYSCGNQQHSIGVKVEEETWEYYNFDNTTSYPDIEQHTPQNSDPIEELMIPNYYPEPAIAQPVEPAGAPTTEPAGISIWDLINLQDATEKEQYLDNSTTAERFCPALKHESAQESHLSLSPQQRSFRFQPTTTQESFLDIITATRRRYSSFTANALEPSGFDHEDAKFSRRDVSSFNSNSIIYNRGRSISKMSLSELYEVMGLAHDHDTAMEREDQIMCILEKYGFCVGEKTWIRDTEEYFRRKILDSVYKETFDKFGYSKRVLEAIIRRGTYARMQSNLRRRRRRGKKVSGRV